MYVSTIYLPSWLHDATSLTLHDSPAFVLIQGGPSMTRFLPPAAAPAAPAALLCWIQQLLFFLMLRTLYRIICKNAKSFFGKNSLNVSNVKPFSKIFFNIFGFFMPFWWEWQLALYILNDFPGIENLNGINNLNNLSGLNDLYSLISWKNL